MKNVILVNNTQSDIRGFVEAAIINAVKTDGVLPEELQDIFTLEVIEVDGEVRGILNAA